MSRFLKGVQNAVRTVAPKTQGIEGTFFNQIEILEAEPGYMKVVYSIDKINDCNPMGNMHGGRIATLVDSATGIAAVAGRANTDVVTVDLAVSYLRGIDVNDSKKIIIESTVDKAGRKITFASCKIKNMDESKTFAIGRQTVVVVENEDNPIFTDDVEE